MQATELKTERINGVEVRFSVTSYGKFVAEWGENLESSDTLEKLEAKVKRLTADKPVRIQYPFSFIEGDKVKNGVAVGTHARTYEPLLRHISGEVIKDTFSLQGYYRRLSNEERVEGEQLLAQVRAASDALNRWKQDKAINIRREVAQAVKAEKEKQETKLRAV